MNRLLKLRGTPAYRLFLPQEGSRALSNFDPRYRLLDAEMRDLAQDAMTDGIREHLAEIALQYEKLAESAEGFCDPEWALPFY